MATITAISSAQRGLMMNDDELDTAYSKLARMASAYLQMLRDFREQVVTRLASCDPSVDPEEHGRLSEMHDALVDAIMGLESLNQANKREPFSA